VRAKCSALLQISGQVASLLEEDPLNPVHLAQFQRIERCNHRSSTCLEALSPLTNQPSEEQNKLRRTDYCDLIVSHSMLSTGMILLNFTLASGQSESMDKCRLWTRKMIHTIHLVDKNEFQYFPPVLAICWAVAADVILQELHRPNPTAINPEARCLLEEELGIILNAQQTLSSLYPVAGVLGDRIRSRINGEQFPLSTVSPSPTSSQYSC